MKRSRKTRKLFQIFVLTLLACAAWYLMNRVRSEGEAITVFQRPGYDAPPAFSGALTLATFNIAHGRGTNDLNISDKRARRMRLEKIGRMLKQEHVDIAVLQEVDFDAVGTGHENQARIVAEAGGFEYVLEQRNFDMAMTSLGQCHPWQI